MSAELCPPHGAQDGQEEAAGLAVHVSAFALKSLLGYGEQGRFGGNQRGRQLSSTSVNKMFRYHRETGSKYGFSHRVMHAYI
jgi:hypothetical protein